jgi:hypothetical protein
LEERGDQLTRIIIVICGSLDGGVSHFRSSGSWHLKVYPEILLVVDLAEFWKMTATACDTATSLFPTITHSTLTHSMEQNPSEKLTGLQLIKKFSTFYGTRRFLTTVTNARQLSLS